MPPPDDAPQDPKKTRGSLDPEQVKCPECDDILPSRFALGGHRFREHGVTSSKPKRGRKAPAGAPTPPRAPRPAGGGDKAPRGQKAPAGATKTKADLRKLAEVLEVGLLLTGDAYCADIVKRKGPPVIEHTATLIADNPSVARLVEMAGAGSGWAALGLAVLGLTVPIMAHHGVLKPGVAVLVGAPIPPARKAAAPAVPGDVVTPPPSAPAAPSEPVP